MLHATCLYPFRPPPRSPPAAMYERAPRVLRYADGGSTADHVGPGAYQVPFPKQQAAGEVRARQASAGCLPSLPSRPARCLQVNGIAPLPGCHPQEAAGRCSPCLGAPAGHRAGHRAVAAHIVLAGVQLDARFRFPTLWAVTGSGRPSYCPPAFPMATLSASHPCPALSERHIDLPKCNFYVSALQCHLRVVPCVFSGRCRLYAQTPVLLEHT